MDNAGQTEQAAPSSPGQATTKAWITPRASSHHLGMALASSHWWSQWSSLTTFFLLLLPASSWSGDPLPAPAIFTDPLYDVYYEGEDVTIRCQAVTRSKVRGFRFFNQRGEQIHQRAPYTLPIVSYQLTATMVTAGNYSCLYFVEDSGQELLSHRSLPFTLQVQAAPTAPMLSLDPQQEVYSPGSSIQLLCSIPSSADNVQEVQFYGDSGFAVSTMKNYSYDLDITGEELSGSYSCTYTVMKSKRLVKSQRSRHIDINVQRPLRWLREVLVGGSFFTINGLIFFISHHLKKRREVQD